MLVSVVSTQTGMLEKRDGVCKNGGARNKWSTKHGLQAGGLK